MPDDKKATEQEPEVKDETLDEGEAAFGEDIEDEETPSGEEEEPAKPKRGPGRPPKIKPEDKGEEEFGKGEKPEPEKEPKEESKEKEPKEEKKLSIEEMIKKRIESLEAEEEEDKPLPSKKEEKPKEEKKEELEEPEEKPKPTKLNKELLAERLSLISKDDLPEEMIIGDETVNLKQYAEDYPDDFVAIRVLSSMVAEKMVNKALGGISSVKPEDVDSKMVNIERQVAQISFDNIVAQTIDEEGGLKHPDYYVITRGSGMKDFHAWVKEQSPKIQKLANSLDPEDGVLILDYYKEAFAKKNTAEHDKKTKDKKKEYDDIYKSEKSVKKNQPEVGAGEKAPGEEAEEAFNEES